MSLKPALTIILFFLIHSAHAQEEMAPDFMRSVGKIYVVAAVTIVILVTLFIYMIIIDRKITRLEKKGKQNE